MFLLFACGKSKKATHANDRFSPTTDPHLEQGLIGDRKTRIDFYFVEGATQVALKNYEEAIGLYKEVLKQDIHNSAAAYEISRCLQHSRRNTEALQFAIQARTEDSQNYWYGLQVADLQLINQKTEDAKKTLEQLALKYPNDRDIHIKLSEIYLSLNQTDKSLEQLVILDKITGHSPEIAIQKFRILSGVGRNEEAAKELKTLLASNPYEINYYQILYEFYQAIGKPTEALEVLENMLQVDPGNSFALITLSQHYRSQGKKELAEQYQKKALQSSQVNIEGKVQFLLALLNDLEKDSTQAPEISRLTDTLIAQHGDYYMLLAIRADLFRFMGQLDSARFWLKKALTADPSHESLWQNLLYIDAGKENYTLLWEDSELALEVFPNQMEFLYLNGVSAFTLKKYPEAKIPLEKLLKQPAISEERKLQTLELLGDLYHYLGDYSRSDATFEQVLKIDSKNATVLNNYAYYLSLRSLELEKAEQLVLKAIQLQPETASFEDTYGWILYQRGKYAEALEWVQKAMNRQESPDIADHLGDIYFRLGKPDKSMELWKKAKELGLTGPEIERKIKDGVL